MKSEKQQDKKYYTYIILTENNKYYCGYTVDIQARFQKHCEGIGAKYTRANKPEKLVYCKEHLTKSDAMKEEIKIKKLSRKQKEEFLKSL